MLSKFSSHPDIIAIVLDYSFAFPLSAIGSVKKQASKPVIVKGVMTQEEAKIAIESGADALWISHTTSTGQPNTISVLKGISEIARQMKPDIDIYVDGGVRRGTDVAKCLALGANMVFLSRPVAWGLHYAGKEGVQLMINIIHEEFKTVMILTNSMSVGALTEKHVIHHRARL